MRHILLVDIGNALALSGVLPSVALNAAYSARLTARGGRAPYTYTVSAGTLPTGLYLDPATGIVSGTATASGTASFTVRATDTSGRSVQRSYAITVIAEPAVLTLTGTFAAATVGTAYSSDLTITNGTAPYTLHGGTGVTAGTLPDGLALSIVGDKLRLSGTASGTAATVNATVAVDSEDGQTATSAQSIEVTDESSVYPDLVMSLAPRAYWKFGESSGVTASDSSGNGNIASLGKLPAWGRPALIPSTNTTAVGNDGLVVGSIPPSVMTLSTPTSEITLIAWIKISSATTTAALFSGRGSNSSTVLDLSVGNNGVTSNPGKLACLIRADNGSGLAYATGTTLLNDGVRHMVAFRRTSLKVCSLWVDGVKEASVTDAMTAGITPSFPEVFHEPQNSAIKTLVGDAAHWSVHGAALSDADILALWDAGKS